MSHMGIDQPRQSHATYEACAPPTSHHGWILMIYGYYHINSFSVSYTLEAEIGWKTLIKE